MSMRWYIVHAYSNFENKVAQSIRDQAAQRNLVEHPEFALCAASGAEVQQLDSLRRKRCVVVRLHQH